MKLYAHQIIFQGAQATHVVPGLTLEPITYFATNWSVKVDCGTFVKNGDPTCKRCKRALEKWWKWRTGACANSAGPSTSRPMSMRGCVTRCDHP